MSFDKGSFVVKCIKTGGDTLSLYGFSATEGQEVDLLSDSTPASIRAASFAGATNMCDPSFELGQKINLGQWVVVRSRHPNAAI